MAQHPPQLHHQQQQPSPQQVAGSQLQQTQTNSQNNNLTNYPISHPSQSHSFNSMQSGGGMYMHPHGVAPVGGAMYLTCPMTTNMPGNVYVNNVTANVNLHGYVSHSHFIPGSPSNFIPGEVQQNMHMAEQNAPILQQSGNNQPSRAVARRGKGRGGGNGRRNEMNQRQQLSPAPPDAINQPVDPQNVGSTYQPYYQFGYPQPFFGTSAQNVGHPQVQQAAGAPLYVAASHVPMFAGSQVYNYPHVFYPAAMIASEYPLVDDKENEQLPPEGMIPQMWPDHMSMEYHEEYINPELVEDANHNASPLISSDTPSLLSPNFSIYESQIHSQIEIQQKMNTLHIYESQQETMQHEVQIEDSTSVQTLNQIESTSMQPYSIRRELPVSNQMVNASNNNEIENISNDVPAADIKIIEITQPASTFLNTAPPPLDHTAGETFDNVLPVSDKKIFRTGRNTSVMPSVQSSIRKTNVPNKCEHNSKFVPSTTDNESTINRSLSWTYPKKTTASIAITAAPVNNLNDNLNKNVTANPSSISMSSKPKNVPIAKNTSLPISASDPINEKKSNADLNHGLPDSVKVVTTASIASTALPQQLQDVQLPQPEDFTAKTEISSNNIRSTQTSNKDTSKPVSDDISKSKKDDSPRSWASLFSAKSTNVPHSSSQLNTSTVGKKPVAKVFPFEGTTNFIPSAATPTGMSYSAASAQGIVSSNSSSIPKAPTTVIRSNIPKDNNTDESAVKFADFLVKYKVDYTPVSWRPRGLTNRSNYCYVNAILQALVGCSPFYNLMKSIPRQFANSSKENTNTPTINAMAQFISEFSNLPAGVRINRREKGQKKDEIGELQCDPAFEPSGIYKLWNSNRVDVEGRQEDAEEFLGFVLNKINDEMLETIKLNTKSNEQSFDTNLENDDGEDWQMIYNNRNKGSVTRQTDFGKTPLSDIFRGELRSRLQREGEHSTDVIQPFFTLQLNIEKAASVKEALEILVGRDELEGVTCSKTNQQVVAWQQITLEKLPVILILHLKWFDYKMDGCTKILKTVDFPVELKIDTKILANKKYSQKQRLYRLCAVVYHDGKEASKGHYITDVYHTVYGNWLRFDDSTVKPVSEHNVLRPRGPRVPYLLYYRRCDTLQYTTQNATNSK